MEKLSNAATDSFGLASPDTVANLSPQPFGHRVISLNHSQLEGPYQKTWDQIYWEGVDRKKEQHPFLDLFGLL